MDCTAENHISTFFPRRNKIKLMEELWRNWTSVFRSETFSPSAMYVALRAVMAENPALYRYIILNVINTFMEELLHTESSAVNLDQNLSNWTSHTALRVPLCPWACGRNQSHFHIQ